MSDIEPIGTVEVLKMQVYPLDAAATDDGNRTEVCVPAGTYAVYRQGLSHFWLMTGRVNTGRIWRNGDGIFTLIPADIDEGPEVTFPSRFFGPDEWADFLDEPRCTEGDLTQRLRFRLSVDSDA